MPHQNPLRKILAQSLALFFGLSVSLLPGAGVISLKDNSETGGKLTLSPTALHIETGATPIDMPLGDILEADFTDSPFQMNYFSSRNSPNQLPANWKAQDIGTPPVPGKSSYADGVLTVTGSGVDMQRQEKEDAFFFIGQSWTGDGQFTARLKEIPPPDSPTLAGPMVRDSLDPLSLMLGIGLGNGGGGSYIDRNKTGDHVGWSGFLVDLPIWFQLSWRGNSIDFATSSDGKTWEVINQTEMKTVADHWIGLFVTRADKTAGTAIFDQLLFTPATAEPGTLPAGVLLTSGSFLAGAVDFLNPNSGSMTHSGKAFSLLIGQVAAIIAHPLTERQIANMSAKQGVMMKNGDFLEAEIQNIQGTYVQINSLALGLVSYEGDAVLACSLHPVKYVPSEYEIRLKDGSIIRAKGFSVANGQIALDEVSGITINVNPEEIAQFRAGSAHVQNLIDLPWKVEAPVAATASPSAVTKTAPPTPAAEAATNNAPATPSTTPAASPLPANAGTGTDANSAPGLLPPAVETWQGPNQEQIIVAAAESTITFPLGDKFRALSLRIALSPDSPPDAQATLRILADGREIGRTPPLKSGDAPRLVQVTLQNPKNLTFAIESPAPRARLMIIDPVAIRDSGAP